ncbi:MAG: hypothetical protein ABFR82_07580 [Nitrospirota bacterium]
MKKTFEETGTPKSCSTDSRLKNFFQSQKDKLKHGQFKCPLCREVFTGISALGSHLKNHCT